MTVGQIDGKLIIDIGQKKDAKRFYLELKDAVYKLIGALYDEEDFWRHVIKRVRRSYHYSRTEYYYVNENINMLGNIDTEHVLDMTFVKLLEHENNDFLHNYNAKLIRIVTDTHIHNEIRYEVNISHGSSILTKSEMAQMADDQKHGITDIQQKLFLYNFALKKWEAADCIGAAFMNESLQGGFIDIDCKNEAPERIKNLFIRSLTRLYARIALLEYEGTNNKRDDYLRDEFEKHICRPVIKGTTLHCNLWSTGEIGDYDGYGEKKLWTYDHAFKTFMARSGDIDFLARVCISGHCSEDHVEVFYTKEGKIFKMDQDDWKKPYSCSANNP